MPHKVPMDIQARCLLTLPHRSSVRVRRLLRQPDFAHTRRIRRKYFGGIKKRILENKNCSSSPKGIRCSFYMFMCKDIVAKFTLLCNG